MRSTDGIRENAAFNRWFAEQERQISQRVWFEGFSAGWDECDDPDGFVNDKWDSKTANPYLGENK
jgi:hypothetical protein